MIVSLALDKTRTKVGEVLRSTRKRRAWTQTMLAKELGLSQGRLSEIERGEGSLSAEQFLHLLLLFNLTVADFGVVPSSPDTELQNALSRHGANHLVESADVFANDSNLESLIRDALASGSPRLVVGLAPVLVRNATSPLLNRLRVRLAEAGIGRRYGWLLENVRAAVESELREPLSAAVSRHYRRIQVILDLAIEPLVAEPTPLDVLDTFIRSRKTVDEVREAASAISNRWGIVTSIAVADFIQALRATREGG